VLRNRQRRAPRFSVTGKLSLLFGACLLLGATTGAALSAFGLPPLVVWSGAMLIGLPGGLIALRALFRQPLRVLEALDNGIEGFRSGDFSVRLAVSRDDELGHLVELFNDIADTLSAERGDIRQRQLLLETALQSSPMAVVLTNAVGRVLFGNQIARTMLADGRRLEGLAFEDIAAACPEPFRRVIGAEADAMVSVSLDGAEETFHVIRRVFELNAQRHHLVLVRNMSSELRGEEMAAYKRVIRSINHELNNTLAPLSSLIHSARLIVDRPEERGRLDEVFGTIDECLSRLRRYVEGHAEFARLPTPRLADIDLVVFLRELQYLVPFQLEAEAETQPVRIDPAQLQQVVLNLVRNAKEAGSPEKNIVVKVSAVPDRGVVMEVCDRGGGMEAETMAKALIPFFSTKDTGSGLGLALAREILQAHGGRLNLAARDGGGLVVSCRLPAPERSP
jgi:two-component system nitrogen regulation sensor histidine kinase NtrY